MSGSMKDLIRNIRSSKTASEERSVLAKECAKIRSSLNSDSLSSRRKNIPKLLFINLLGHPTNFGQIECIKLIASSKFADKRTGYLALNLLLNEDSEVLMLATNSIKIDLNDPNPYVREMALRSLANVGTTEMLRELQYEIDQNMNHNVPNIKKKATVCAVRMLRREAHRNLTPDSVSVELARSFMRYVEPLLADYDSGVKLAALSLMAVLLEHYTDICNLGHFFQLLLRALAGSLNPNPSNVTVTFPSSTENFTNQNMFADQSSNDPFLKVKLLSQLKHVYLKLLANKPRSPGENSADPAFDMSLLSYKEKLYEIVYSIINSEGTNHAILLECVSAVECEFAEDRFNELGKLVVKKFMAVPINNVKYLALGIIKKLYNVNMVHGDSNWTIIVQSFKQPDFSIRKKALEVSLKVVNKDTLDPILQYLYEFLLSVDEDTKKESIHGIFNCVNTHSDDVAYKLRVLVKIFTIAGNSVQDVILFDFMDLLLSSTDAVKAETTLELLKVLRHNMGQSALVKSALYAIGEYYQLLSPADLKATFSSHSPVNSARSNLNTPTSADDDDNPKLSNDTSLDLLLDLSTPTNRNTANHNGSTAPKDNDFLLDLQSPESTPLKVNGTSNPPRDSGELFDLYNFSARPESASSAARFELPGKLEPGKSPHGESDYDLMLTELISNVSIRLTTKNLLNECEFLITCIGKLAHKMPSQVENLRKVLRKFRRHSNPELQQRSCELEIMIQENIVALANSAEKGVAALSLDAEDDFMSFSQPKGKDTPTDSMARTSLVDEFDFSASPKHTHTSGSLDTQPARDKAPDIFDEFFGPNSAQPPADTHTSFVEPVRDRDPFNMEKLANSIAENVAVVSSREKREDDFQQFDPF